MTQLFFKLFLVLLAQPFVCKVPLVFPHVRFAL